jgi:hypothetical protein
MTATRQLHPGQAPVDLSRLRDITDIEKIPLPADVSAPLWLWLAIPLVLVLSLLIIWRCRRRLPRKAPTVPPDRWALAELDRLQADSAATDAERFHTRLTDIVREYLERRFSVQAFQRTTSEFMQALVGIDPLSTEQRKTIGSLLERCDFAKFARTAFSRDECIASAQMAQDVIASIDRRNGVAFAPVITHDSADGASGFLK